MLKINKFVISLHYLTKEERDGVEFLHANKHETVLQVDTIHLGEHSQACPNSSNDKFAKFLHYLNKEVRNEFDFLCR